MGKGNYNIKQYTRTLAQGSFGMINQDLPRFWDICKEAPLGISDIGTGMASIL